MVNPLPKKLNKEPLLDVVFEVRFSANSPASSILPGIFFNKLKGKKIINQLSASELPKQLRDTDPQLQFTPLVQISWDRFRLLIGDRNVAIGCIMPYVGWLNFKQAIIEIIEILCEVETINFINRYSMKYVDLIPLKKIEEQIAAVNLNIRLGNHFLKSENFQFRIELLQDEYINVIQVISSALVNNPFDKTTKEGLVIDIDTIHNIDGQQISDFNSGIQTKLDKIHRVNKITFFDCITPATLNSLEPIYE